MKAREIKFRAWDRVVKQIWDGNNIIGPKADYTVATQQPSIWRLNEFLYELSKGITLLQYTGLKDQNGKEIYEGDIVRFYDDGAPDAVPIISVVVFENGCFYPRECARDVMEVIGNIYENPELIK